MRIELAQAGEALALRVVQQTAAFSKPARSLDERITTALSGAASALPFDELRSQCRVRGATLYERLAALVTGGRIVKDGQGYRLAP